MFESRDGGATWSLLSTLDGQPGRGEWNDPANQPPAISASPRSCRTRTRRRASGRSCRIRDLETTDDGGSWTPRNRGLRADWPLENPEIGYCVHKLVMSPVDHDRLYQQNHVGMHRSDDAGRSWVEITEGLPTEFGFAAAAHPHDRDTFYVVPLDPGHGRCMPEGRAAVWRTRDAGSSWQRLDSGLPQRDAHLGVLREGLAIDALDVLRLYFGTSTGQVFASADEGETWSEIASYLPGISRRSRWRPRDGRRPPARPAVALPDLRVGFEIDAATSRGDRPHGRALARPPRPAAAGPALRTHINVYVDRERAGLDTTLEDARGWT